MGMCLASTDSIEIWIASSGILLGHLKNVENKINADNQELAFAA